MRLQLDRVYHHRLWGSGLGGQASHDPGEDTFVTPPLAAVVEGFRSAVLPRHVAPSQLIALRKIMPLNTWRSSTRGLAWLFAKKGWSRAICASVSQKSLSIAQSPCGD